MRFLIRLSIVSRGLLLLIFWGGVQQANAQTLGWVQGLGSSESFEQGEQVLTDQAGNIYVAGTFSNTVDFDFSANKTELTAQGNSDAFFVKYNAKRELQWAKSIGGSAFVSITRMVLDEAGNIYVTGGFDETADFDPSAATKNLTSAGCDDAFLAKYNNDGEYQWAFQIGGTQCDFGSNVVLDKAGNIYMTGNLRGSTVPVDFDPGTGTTNLSAVGTSASLFMAKYSGDGAYQWAFVVGSPTEFKNLADFDLVLNQATNELIIVGRLEGVADFDPGSNTVSLDEANGVAFIAKYSTDGNYILAKNFGTEAARSIALDNLGNIYICGSYKGSDVDFDPGSNATKLTSKGEEDWFIAKYSNAIELQWVKGLGSVAHNDFPESIALDASNNVYVAGDFTGELSFNDPSNTTKIQSKGSTDGLLVSYDKDGNFRLADNIGGVDFDAVYGMSIDQNTNGIYLTGAYTATADFAINNGTSTTLTSQGGEDIFFALYGDAEINLALNNRNIASGATLNFGDISVGSSSADSTIAIESKGVFTLTLTGTTGSLVALSGTNASDFTVTQTGVTSDIDAGTQVTFTVSYTPSVEGAASALLTIQSNDDDEGTYTLQLAGTGVNSVTNISEQLSNLIWKIGPNPTNDQITITNQEHNSQSVRYQIVDQKGSVLLSRLGKFHQGSFTISLDQIPKGHYLLMLQVGNKQVTKRVVKR